MPAPARNDALAGCHALVTRTRSQAGRLSVALEDCGAVAVEVPILHHQEVDDGAGVRAAVADLGRFDDLVLTSTNAVAALLRALAQTGVPVPAALRVSAVGEATAAAARAGGLQVHLQPQTYIAEALADVLEEAGLEGRRVLYPRAKDARDVLVERLEQAGADVTLVFAYQMVRDPAAASGLQVAANAGLDVITAASSRTIGLLDEVLADSLPSDVAAWYRRLPVVAIGEATALTARALGYPVVATADPSTVDGIVAATVGWWATGPRSPSESR